MLENVMFYTLLLSIVLFRKGEDPIRIDGVLFSPSLIKLFFLA